jgi:hypothetical protein
MSGRGERRAGDAGNRDQGIGNRFLLDHAKIDTLSTVRASENEERGPGSCQRF